MTWMRNDFKHRNTDTQNKTFFFSRIALTVKITYYGVFVGKFAELLLSWSLVQWETQLILRKQIKDLNGA